MNNKPYILYSTNCPRCKMLKSKIDQLNLDYFVENDVKKIIEKGYNIVPVLFLVEENKALNYNEAITYLQTLEVK